MTDGGQEATQEPEPITPDNNFPKASFPSSTSTPLYTYTQRSAVDPFTTNPEIRHFCCHFARIPAAQLVARCIISESEMDLLTASREDSPPCGELYPPRRIFFIEENPIGVPMAWYRINTTFPPSWKRGSK
ncbi:hypothetical protein K0M31_016992 [Melipona bicolor]|uniref:Uncharacterized protein n=1 Tax=Melipona bicolor TaxID=60889 RepID=A0AA40FDL8_9HYME|nr:hypothetical protein K0M31_016992 [Melipona bicolor]